MRVITNEIIAAVAATQRAVPTK